MVGFSWNWHQVCWISHVPTTPRRFFQGCWPLARATDSRGIGGVQSVYSWGNFWKTPVCSWPRPDHTGIRSAKSSEANRARMAGSSPSVGGVELSGGVTGQLANAATAGCQFLPPPQVCWLRPLPGVARYPRTPTPTPAKRERYLSTRSIPPCGR